MRNKLYKKLFKPRIWTRIYRERFSESLLHNIASLIIFFFGTYRKKIEYDLIPRQPYAFGIDLACRLAKKEGVKNLVLVEFGVAAGAGLMNMIDIAAHLTKDTGITFKVVGFDTGSGMPSPQDFRDHPEMYREGDFFVPDREKLIASLPPNAKIYFGDVKNTLSDFFRDLSLDEKIGFISVDLDFYSSTKKGLEILKGEAHHYLSSVPMYFDDVIALTHNEYCGELLAIKEFNQELSGWRKISVMTQLRYWRLFKHEIWTEQMYFSHIFDHTFRNDYAFHKQRKKPALLENPYLDT